jgi:hypothetical protein
MSVFWEKGRRDLEEFCQACRLPSLDNASPFNWYMQPQPPQLLRASVAVAFRRAVLKNTYTLLRGKDLETGKPSPDQRDAQFARLAQAQEHVLNLTNWHEFLLCLERAGFRGKKMISSDNAIVFSYAMWLIGRVDYGVPVARLREVIARWFFMAHATSRYSGTFETQVESDLARLVDLPPGDANGFVQTLSKVVDDTLTNDFWEISLPNELSSSASKSPALLAYIAALNIVDANAFAVQRKGQGQTRSGYHSKEGHRASPSLPASIPGPNRNHRHQANQPNQPNREHGVGRMERQHQHLRPTTHRLLARTGRKQGPRRV